MKKVCSSPSLTRYFAEKESRLAIPDVSSGALKDNTNDFDLWSLFSKKAEKSLIKKEEEIQIRRTRLKDMKKTNSYLGEKCEKLEKALSEEIEFGHKLREENDRLKEKLSESKDKSKNTGDSDSAREKIKEKLEELQKVVKELKNEKVENEDSIASLLNINQKMSIENKTLNLNVKKVKDKLKASKTTVNELTESLQFCENNHRNISDDNNFRDIIRDLTMQRNYFKNQLKKLEADYFMKSPVLFEKSLFSEMSDLKELSNNFEVERQESLFVLTNTQEIPSELIQKLQQKLKKNKTKKKYYKEQRDLYKGQVINFIKKKKKSFWKRLIRSK